MWPTAAEQADLDLGQLQHLGEGVDAVGVGAERVQPPAAEDGGGHGPQPVAAQVQLLQLLQPGQFAAVARGGSSRQNF